jgi:UDP-glucose 4-epimerase
MKGVRRVIVTGGAGFICSHLVNRLLGSGADVLVVDDLSGGSKANLPAGVPLLKIDVGTAEAVAAIVEVRISLGQAPA